MKYAINAPSAPDAIGPYSQGTTAGRLVFASGQLPVDQENPYVLVDFIRTPSFPITQAQRVLAENEWNKYEAAIKVLTEDIGKDYTPRDFVPPDSWKHPPLDFMTELFASTTGKEQYTGRSNKANFRKKSIEDYINDKAAEAKGESSLGGKKV